MFYLGGDNHIMVAEYTAKSGSFISGKPRQWSPTPIARTGFYRPLDLAPDGKRFVVSPMAADMAGDNQGTVHVTVLLNFFDELRRKLQ